MPENKLLTYSRDKLPVEYPKPAQEDPQAPTRTRSIMEHANYIQADRDSTFLQRDDVRDVRLQVDYFKAELLLREHGIHATIVVFGGTHIVEPAEARRQTERLQMLAGISPNDEALQAQLAVARAFGQIVGSSGSGSADCRLTLATGGGPGIMEAANRGAFDVGAKSIGYNIDLPFEQFPNPYISTDLCFRFHYFGMRKLHFLHRAKALVAFPGGYGTMDELFETLTLIQTHKIKPIPVILVGKEFWQQAINFDFLVEEGLVAPGDQKLFSYARSAEGAWQNIVKWYEERKKPLIGEEHGKES